MAVFTVVSSVKEMVCPVAVSVITILSASTVPPKVVPFESTIVIVPRSMADPTLPVILTAPAELMVRSEVPLTLPSMVAANISEPEPAPSVRLTPSAMVVLYRVISPVEVPPITALSVTFTGVIPPRLRTPVPAASRVPATFLDDGDTAVTPFVKDKVSPLLFPRVKTPVLLKVTALVKS